MDALVSAVSARHGGKAFSVKSMGVMVVVCINPLAKLAKDHAMQQIRIFKGLESNLPALEKEVNGWLAESKVRVVQVFGNLAAQSGARHEGNSLAAYPYVASDVMLVVVFEPPGA